MMEGHSNPGLCTRAPQEYFMSHKSNTDRINVNSSLFPKLQDTTPHVKYNSGVKYFYLLVTGPLVL